LVPASRGQQHRLIGSAMLCRDCGEDTRFCMSWRQYGAR
jgi:hypothetical protein